MLRNLLSLGRETEWVEYKHNWWQPDKLGDIVSSLANSALLHGESYGYIIWGVDDNLVVKGTTLDFKGLRYKNQSYEHYLRCHLTPKVPVDHFAWDHDGHRLEALRVSAAPSQPVTYKGEAHFRIGEHKKNLRDWPNVAKKIWTAETPSEFEHAYAADGLVPYDVISLLSVDTYFKLANMTPDFDPSRVATLLLDGGVIVRDEQDRLAIPNYTALALARRLEQFPELRDKSPRLIFYKGKNKVEASRPEIRGQYGYAVGFNGLIKYMTDMLPASEAIESVLRVETSLYPEVAIRELVANALIHQDLTQSGTHPMIEVFSDRIEITNNGLPLIAPLRFIDEVPRSRNDALADLMNKLKLFEGRGSGVKRVITAAEAHQLPAPDFLQRHSHTVSVLYAPRPVSEMTKEERVRACYQHASLKFVSNEYLTNTSLRDRFSLSSDGRGSTAANRIIKDTVEAELIVPDVERGPNARYVPFWAPELRGRA